MASGDKGSTETDTVFEQHRRELAQVKQQLEAMTVSQEKRLPCMHGEAVG